MKQFDLNGIWDVFSTDGNYSFSGMVPGTVFQYMEESGEFGDGGVFYREENRKCLDLARRDFVFRRTFILNPGVLESGAVFLEADGIDTVSSITVNGVHAGDTANMHRRYSFPVRGLLKPGENSIEVRISNPLDYVDAEHSRRKLGHSYWQMPEYAYQGFNMIRKSHCSFGWDWGPIIPDMGIWRDIKLVSYQKARLRAVGISQRHADGRVSLVFSPEVEFLDDVTREDVTIDLTLTAPSGEQSFFLINSGKETTITIDNPALWWPNGLGDQALYALSFILSCKNEEVDCLDMNLGLRTLTVRRDKDQWGESFVFEVNGIQIFARGADYIPEDVFLARMNRDRTEKLIQSAAAANFNCIRVWGGGIYPGFDFFDLCDRYGLIVWQDCMFACASYDINNPEFLENIKEEVRDNLLRIRHHASLGLICGNNEMEWGTMEWEPKPTTEMVAEYLKQYEQFFPQIVKEICPDIFYWPSSPSSGGNFDEPNSPDRGDTHYWEVWHGNADYTDYTHHYFRFMSEFGFESFPSMKTIRSFSENEDMNIFSPVLEDHQRCMGGNGKILNYIARYFRYPRDLDSLVYISQISQAEAMRHGIEHWRRNRGRCMGAVYWQLNDNWPVASWSSIDYFGRWKALHYTAKRAYDNVLLSVESGDNDVCVHISNEGKEDLSGEVRWRLSRTDGKIVKAGASEAHIPAFSSEAILREVFEKELGKGFEGKRNARDLMFFAEFEDTMGALFRTFALFAPSKWLSLMDPGIRASVKRDEKGLAVTLESAQPALFVELGLEEGDAVFSDNFFHLEGGIPVTIYVTGIDLEPAGFKKKLVLRSLTDSYD